MADTLTLSCLTLWRGTTLLGRFEASVPVTHHDKPVGAAGILQPTDAFAGTQSMMQTRIPVFPGKPVFQHPIDAIVVGAPPSRTNASPRPQALQPMSPDEARGVPAERVLTVRDPNGGVIDADMITLWLTIIPDHVDLAAVSAANQMNITSREHWQVSYSKFDTPPPATRWAAIG